MTNYLDEAIASEPEGATCSFCLGENTFADDYGWFYIEPEPHVHGYVCEDCFRGEPGEKHIARWGLGER